MNRRNWIAITGVMVVFAGLASAQQSTERPEWVDVIQSSVAEPQRLTTVEVDALEAAGSEALEQTVAFGDRSAGTRIALYIPNRIVDFLDCVSGMAGLGGQLGLEFHITRWVGLGLGVRGSLLNVYWYFCRNLGFSVYDIGAFAVGGPFQAYYMDLFGAGLNWIDGRPDNGRVVFSKAGPFSLADESVRQGYTDPWGIGFGWTAEFHPVEAADFIVGLVTFDFVDISKDDYGNPERQAIKSYMKP